MAGARTQGVGRGVNWGAFVAMGQQYAEIGRTVERGSSALGEGLGRGLSAIGGAIERKKVRQQQAAERQQARADEQARFDLTRQDRLAENALDNDYRERESQRRQAQWEEERKRLQTQDKISALDRLAGNDLALIRASEQGLVDGSVGAEATQRFRSAQTALGAMLGVQGGGGAGGSLGAPTSSMMERADPNVEAQQRAEMRVGMLKNSPLGQMLKYLPPEQANYAEAAMSLEMARQKRAQAKLLMGNSRQQILDRNTLEREALIYESKAAPTLYATKARGMARKRAEQQAEIDAERRGAAVLSGDDEQAIISGAGQAYSAEAAAARIRQIRDSRKSSDSPQAADERRAAELLTSNNPTAIIQGAGQGYSGEEAARQVGRIREQERKQAEEAKREAEGRLKTRREVLSAVPAALEHRGVGADPMESFQVEDLATAFDSDLTDAQATAIGRHLVGRYDGDARSAAQAIYNAMPEQARTPAARERIRKALGLPPPKKKE